MRPCVFGLAAILVPAVLLLIPAAARAQLQIAIVRGVVTDAQGKPLPGASIALTDPYGSTVASTTSGPAGLFRIEDVAPGSYLVRVDVGGALGVAQPLVVRGSLPIELTLQAAPTVREDVVVQGDASSNAAERPWSLAGDSIGRSPEPLPGQRVQSALASLPGWSAEDNGLLHVRGVDDGLLYVQDGIPVYERLDRLFGMAPDPSGIASMHVMNGYIPPEFGFKSGAVVVVRSRSGTEGSWGGTFEGGVADLDTRYVQAFAAGSLGTSTGLMLRASDERSSRFLDPVDLGNFHNDGRASSAAAQATWMKGSHLFTASIRGGRDRYDVTNSEEQEEAGQDARQRTDQVLLSASWQQARSDRTVWQASVYGRHGSAALLPSAFDTPVTADAERTDNRYGALWSVSHQRNAHTLKFGGEASWLRLDERFSFAVTNPDDAQEDDLSEGALSHGPDDAFEFSGRALPWLASLYAQDAYEASHRLTVNFGARVDVSRLLIDAWQVSPRVGASYRLRPGTTLRASFMRLFQPPQAEYLLLSSSPEARELSPFVDDDDIGGGSSIPPERQTAVDASIAQDIRANWRVEATGWWRRGDDVDDPNVFFGTTVIFPNSIARQHASGLEVSLAMMPQRGWTGSVSYTYARVVQFGPATGGLFLEDEVGEIQDGTEFIPDHDQRHGVFATATYSDRRRWRVSAAFRYQTGTPISIGDETDEELEDQPGSETVDFTTGRVRPRAITDVQAEWTIARWTRADLSVIGWLYNLTNQTYAFNFGNPFSGTHFGAPRRVGFSMRVTFTPREPRN